MESTYDAIKANLFPASHQAIGDWDKFPWHRADGIIQTYKLESSQALAIDVFGTIKVSAERDRIKDLEARSWLWDIGEFVKLIEQWEAANES